MKKRSHCKKVVFLEWIFVLVGFGHPAVKGHKDVPWVSHFHTLIPARRFCRPTMSGRHLLIAADTWQPWFLITQGDKGLSYSGIMWEVLQHLSQSMNFTYTMVKKVS